MDYSEILVALFNGDMSEEEVVAAMYKAYTGNDITPEEVMEVKKNDKARSH